MFVCEPCHAKANDCDRLHFTVSVGPCESCGKRARCYDCTVHHDKPKSPAA